jgi:uncharacterized membrane protein
MANVKDKERFLSGMGGGALLLYALNTKGRLRDALSALGKALVVRGATSFTGPPAHSVEASVTIGRPREEVYRFCRDLTNFPRFMRGLEAVTRMGEGKSRWVARGKRGTPGEWSLEIVEDVENEQISWRTVDARGATRSGVLYLRPAPGRRGTEVSVRLEVEPSGGLFGRWAALRRGEEVEFMLRGDLRRLKQLLEAGTIPTTVGQPSGRKGQ